MRNMSIQIDLTKLFPKIFGYIRKIDIGHLVLLAFALHMFVIPFPSDGGKIFDEAHYVPSALTHLNGIGSNAEHTPLVKLIGALSIAIFGNYWFAWRFPIVLMSTLSIWVMYRLASRFFTRKYALFAAAFLIFDIIYFIHGSIFVLDVPQILFSLWSFDFYFQKKYKWSALTMGISILMKETGLLFLAGLALYHFLAFLKRRHYTQSNFKTFGVYFLILLIVVGGGMWIYDAVYKPVKGITIIRNEHHIIIQDPNGTIISTSTTIRNITSYSVITNPIEHLIYAYTYQSGLGINEPWRAYQFPWLWILPVDPLDHPIYLLVTVTTGDVTRTVIAWHAQGTIPIWYSMWLIVPIAFWSLIKPVFKAKPKRKHASKTVEEEEIVVPAEKKKIGEWQPVAVKKKRKTEKLTQKLVEPFQHRLDLFLICWIIGTYLPWVALGLAMRKIGFNYYMIYTVPALCLGIPYFWQKLNISETSKTIGLTIHLIATILFFLYFFPIPLFRA
jgi:hypothetical protein